MVQAHEVPEAPASGCDPPTPAPAPWSESPAELQPQADPDLAVEWIERTGLDGRLVIERADAGPGWDEAIDPPPPCEQCGGIVRWIDAAGGLHCPTCNPSQTADRLRRLASEARARYRSAPQADAGGDPQAPAPWRLPPWPPVVDPRIIADPVPECRECGRPRVIPGQPGRPVGLCYPCWLKANRKNAPGTNAKAVA